MNSRPFFAYHRKIRRRIARTLFRLSRPKMTKEFLDDVLISFEDIIRMKLCHRHPEPVSKDVIFDSSRKVPDEVVGNVVRSVVGVDIMLPEKECSDLGADTQLFA